MNTQNKIKQPVVTHLLPRSSKRCSTGLTMDTAVKVPKKKSYKQRILQPKAQPPTFLDGVLFLCIVVRKEREKRGRKKKH